MGTDIEKKYYRIKDVADFINESPSTIRYWEKEFRILNPRRSEGGTRFYTKKDIETLQKIKFLIRTKGLKIEAARQQLDINEKNISTRNEALETLRELKSELEGILHALKIRK